MKVFLPIFALLLVVYGFCYEAENIVDAVQTMTTIDPSPSTSPKPSAAPTTKPSPSAKTTATPNPTTAPTISPVTKALNKYVISPDGCSDYYYNLLSQQQKSLYNHMLQTFYTFENVVDMSEFKNMKGEDITQTYYNLLCDHTEIFWLNTKCSWKYNDTPNGKEFISFTAEKFLDENTVMSDLKVIEEVENKVLSHAQSLSSEYEKVLYIYEYLILNAEYNHKAAELRVANTQNTDSYRSGNMVGALVDQTPVCSGYADAFTYLLNQLDIQCFCVRGYSDGQAHRWSMVNMGGDYYLFDVTWGDPNTKKKEHDDISYNYFALTTDKMAVNHTADNDKNYPYCTATKYNYFYYNGLVLEDYSKDKMKTIFENELEKEKSEITFMFTSLEEHNEAMKAILDDDIIHEFIAQHSDKLKKGYSYIDNQEYKYITIILNEI